jgi:hypothetical protein
MADCLMLHGFAWSEIVMRARALEKLIDSMQELIEAMLPEWARFVGPAFHGIVIIF